MFTATAERPIIQISIPRKKKLSKKKMAAALWIGYNIWVSERNVITRGLLAFAEGYIVGTAAWYVACYASAFLILLPLLLLGVPETAAVTVFLVTTVGGYLYMGMKYLNWRFGNAW